MKSIMNFCTISPEKVTELYGKLKDEKDHLSTLYEELESLWKEPDMEVRKTSDRLKADIEYLRETIQRKNEVQDDTKSKKSRRSKASSISSRTSSKIRDAQANIAAKRVELVAQREAAKQEEELRKLEQEKNRLRTEAEERKIKEEQKQKKGKIKE